MNLIITRIIFSLNLKNQLQYNYQSIMGKSKKYNNKYTKDKNVNEDGIKIKQINKKKNQQEKFKHNGLSLDLELDGIDVKDNNIIIKDIDDKYKLFNDNEY